MRPTAEYISNEGDGSNYDNESSTSSDEDEDACELTEDVEKKFFRALSCLKKKDPQIYDQDARFFEKVPEIDENVIKEKRKKKTENPLTLKAYEKKLLESGALIDGEEDSTYFPCSKKKTYVEEQKELKESFKKVLDGDTDDDSDGEIGGLFRENSKSRAEKEEEEKDYREWLKGQRTELDDKTAEGDMKFLHDYWNDPNLGEDEKFLRDYILNKRFLDKNIKDEENPDKFVTLEEDETILNDQIQFEHKYNFRFEEPDQEFIKRYPRVMENSMRKKDNKRKLKREALKKRKAEEKEQKVKDLRKLQISKFKEIEEKIKQIKEATGNEELGFKDEDIEKDFDPNEHDLQMKKLFSEEFYSHEECEKPSFTEDLNLDQYKDDDEIGYGIDTTGNYSAENNYEGDDFNMDCDYTPEKAALAKKNKLEAREKKKNRKKMCSAAESILLNQSIEKPAFDKNLHKSFQNYLDEYYSLDCEDFIGDMPCRFKYREVVPNSFGLTIEEILTADDKELNNWCSFKKINQIRSSDVEKYEVKAYERKATNEDLKRKLLPSLYKSDDNCLEEENNSVKKKKKKKKKKKNKKNISEEGLSVESNENKITNGGESHKTSNKRKRDSSVENIVTDTVNNTSDHNQSGKKFKKENGCNISVKGNSSSDVQNEKKQKKALKKQNSNQDISLCAEQNTSNNVKSKGKNKKLLKNKHLNSAHKISNINVNKSNLKVNRLNKNSVKRKNDRGSFYDSISDERLKAYGIKPKKFKNKIKYGGAN